MCISADITLIFISITQTKLLTITKIAKYLGGYTKLNIVVPYIYIYIAKMSYELMKKF